ncbi:uncharacterized protein [Mytilus edulis]|uniref:uncharacterized protein isoform X2 n=1 Tax=Mytilus edulis TaxID=6550 RepID=UPI0039F14D90
MITYLILLIIWIVTASSGYDFRCPDRSQWKLRAKAVCLAESNYVCLFHILNNYYMEDCIGIDYSKIGSKLVFQPIFNLAYCNDNRYQPFTFSTQGNAECVFPKSNCNEEGQIVYRTGNESVDVACLCNYKRAYAFITEPKNKCFCIPTMEDCSCYRVNCHKLSADYECIRHDVPTRKTMCDDIGLQTPNKTNTTTTFVLRGERTGGLSYADQAKITIGITAVTALIFTVLYIYAMKESLFEEAKGSVFEEINKACMLGEIDKENLSEELKKSNTLVEKDKDDIMKEEDKEKNILHNARVKHYFARVMFIGKHGAGKTSLRRRLLWRKKEDVVGTESTDGIEISKCMINVQDGKWRPCDKTDEGLARSIQYVFLNEQIKTEDSVVNKKESSNTKNDIMTKEGENDKVSNFNKSGNKNIASKRVEQDETSTDTEDRKTSKTEKMDTPANINTKQSGEAAEQKTQDTVEQDKNKIEKSKHKEDGDLYKSEFQNDVDVKSNNESDGSSDISSNEDFTEEIEEELDLNENDEQNNDDNILEKLNKITYDIVKQYVKHSALKQPAETFASCWLWDFAGQKDFYATHQAFLSSSAVYVLVADSIEFSNIEALWMDFEESAQYVRFWCDVIHCYWSTTAIKRWLEPAIVIVHTNKDNHKDELEQKKHHKKFIENIGRVLKEQDPKKHIREIYYISNTEDDDNSFQKIREFISKLTMDMKGWGTEIPFTWLLLQQVIEQLKESNVPFSTTKKLRQMANHKDIGITDDTDFRDCLQYFHGIGTIIYFDEKGLREHIILDPQWLVDAFKCVVSDKVDTGVKCSDDFMKLEDTGLLSYSLLCELLNKKISKYTVHFRENIDHLIRVMKKFDIIVNLKNSSDLYMPCMMKSSTLDKVKMSFIKESSNIDKTSWLCLKFDFLPPVFFNHIIARYMQQFEVSKELDINTRSKKLSLYREIAVFNLTSSGCAQLVLCQAPTVIAVQIWFQKQNHGKEYSKYRRQLCNIVQTLKKRYRLNIVFGIEFTCKDGEFTNDRTRWGELHEPEYRCRQHKETHFSEEVLNFWYAKGYLENQRQIEYKDKSDLGTKTVERKIVKGNAQMRFVGAIDIGVSSSVYAYSATSTNDSIQPSMEIKLNTPWRVINSSLRSYKTPTSILLNKETNKTISAGFDAKQNYEDLDFDETGGYHLLDKFKIQLFQNQIFSKDCQIKDVRGEDVRARCVYSKMIHELKKCLEKDIRTEYRDCDIRPENIQWILTIPATWVDHAEKFVRTCAEAVIHTTLLCMKC